MINTNQNLRLVMSPKKFPTTFEELRLVLSNPNIDPFFPLILQMRNMQEERIIFQEVLEYYEKLEVQDTIQKEKEKNALVKEYREAQRQEEKDRLQDQIRQEKQYRLELKQFKEQLALALDIGKLQESMQQRANVMTVIMTTILANNQKITHNQQAIQQLNQAVTGQGGIHHNIIQQVGMALPQGMTVSINDQNITATQANVQQAVERALGHTAPLDQKVNILLGDTLDKINDPTVAQTQKNSFSERLRDMIKHMKGMSMVVNELKIVGELHELLCTQAKEPIPFFKFINLMKKEDFLTHIEKALASCQDEFHNIFEKIVEKTSEQRKCIQENDNLTQQYSQLETEQQLEKNQQAKLLVKLENKQITHEGLDSVASNENFSSVKRK